MSESGFNVDLTAIRTTFSLLESGIEKSAQSQMVVACHLQERETKKRAPVDTGNLRASYESRVDGRGSELVGHVGTNVDYALYQEYLHNPHVRPALESNRDKINKILTADTLDDALDSI